MVHDFGGPIGLNVAMQFPDRIKNLVVLNSWLWSSETDPAFIKLRKVLNNPLPPFCIATSIFRPVLCCRNRLATINCQPTCLKQYTRPFANRTQRNGALAFARSLLNDQAWFEMLWNNRASIANKPTLFVWGTKDPVISPAYLDKFVSGFPHSTVVKLETSGHFPQEEQPEAVVEAMRAFLGK